MTFVSLEWWLFSILWRSDILSSEEWSAVKANVVACCLQFSSSSHSSDFMSNLKGSSWVWLQSSSASVNLNSIKYNIDSLNVRSVSKWAKCSYFTWTFAKCSSTSHRTLDGMSSFIKKQCFQLIVSSLWKYNSNWARWSRRNSINHFLIWCWWALHIPVFLPSTKLIQLQETYWQTFKMNIFWIWLRFFNVLELMQYLFLL